MARLRKSNYSCIRIEGGLLSLDLLDRLINSPEEMDGLKKDDYHLVGNERLNEAINRSWNRICTLWQSFQEARDKLPESDLGTGMTRERWLLPLFQELGYGRLVPMKAQEIGGKSYPLSHFWHRSPIHLLGFRLPLDRRTPGAAGAATMSPHSLMQEYLNRSERSLWGLLSNGLTLRLLRDNASIASQAFIEFDLEAMMEGELYSDFVLFWLLCHQSRFEADNPADCWMERWCQKAQEEGSRVLDRLRDGVMEAINLLGQGFVAHSANQALRQALRLGELDKQDYYRELLRLVYRIIFLCTAEDRELLLSPNAPIIAQQRYNNYYSLRRLRELAEKRRGTQHCDLYQQLKLIMNGLGQAEGLPALGLPALGSFLWSDTAMPHLMHSELSNRSLLSALRALTLHQQGTRRIRVDFRHLGAEEMGSVYESLLELHPQMHVDSCQFVLQEAAGNERKTTGSYYTRTDLINCLLDSALDPVLEEAANKADPEQAILNLKICDPACGSGQFLVGAARRIAYRLAAIRTGEDEPPQDAYRQALRQVVSRCIYGVDINEMAVELCKTNLWLESLEPGKPLSFLDHHIKRGNSLLGVTPRLLAQGIPDKAFTAIEGDQKKVVSALKKQNRQERTGQSSLFTTANTIDNSALIGKYQSIEDITENQLKDQAEKEQRYEDYLASADYLHQKLLADAWCAVFVWIKDSNRVKHSLTQGALDLMQQDPKLVEPKVVDEINRLARQYQFFHWHISFPTIFLENRKDISNEQTGWQGGFDVVLGNPPWERIKLQEREWFASRVPEIAQAPNAAARHRLIAELEQTDPEILAAFLDARRQAEGESHLIRNSGLYPLCGRGDVNTYAVFAELMKNIISPVGRVGCVIPSGIATDDTTKFFFQDIIDQQALVSLYDFENREAIFTGVHRSYKFCLLTLTGSKRPASSGAEFFFFAHRPEDLDDEKRRFTLTAADLELLNPNTRTCPIFRSRRDAELTKSIYKRVPVLVNDSIPNGNPWGIRFLRMFDMSNDSSLFKTRQQLEMAGYQLEGNVFIDYKETEIMDGENTFLPLYEAKMIHQYDHRFGSYRDVANDSASTQLPTPSLEEYQNSHYVPLPRYWVSERQVIARISDVPRDLARAWLDYDEEEMASCLSTWLSGWQLIHEKTLPLLPCLEFYRGLIKIDSQKARNMASTYPLEEEEIADISQFDDVFEAVDYMVRKRKPRWLVGFRDITNTTNERTAIAAIIPAVGVGNNAPLILFNSQLKHMDCLTALVSSNLSSFALDFVARLKVGGTHMNFFIINQIPVLSPHAYHQICPWLNTGEKFYDWLLPRALELNYTAYDLSSFARDCGYDGPPFCWDEERRFLIRCELDAAYFHLYSIERQDVDYIMETFPVVKRKDEAAYGTYRTKETILDIYDQMKIAIETGVPYKTPLNPPPGPPEVWPLPPGQPWPEHIHPCKLR